MKTQRRGPKRIVSAFRILLLALVCMAPLWVLFTGSVARHELLVGAGALVLSVAFLSIVWRTETLHLRFTLRDIAQAWRIPWYVVSGNYEITKVLWKDLFGTRANSFFRFCGFRASTHDPERMGRQVLTTAYATTAPNFIVIGIDPAQSRMLFHQLTRSPVPKMAQALGAEVGAEK